MHNDSMTKLEKLEWIKWYLERIEKQPAIFVSCGKIIPPEETEIAIQFVEDIRDAYTQDYK